ncbi:hypothetical protein [Methyloradius palustris]|uniref:hypothetical protein n=1 Tax=Methyloradius palustris TaxID=2778876 RepID=UPI001C8B9C85|nr:hypothetical protein [Methyloradius palustris]
MTNEHQNSIYILHQSDTSEEESTRFRQWLISASVQGLIYLFSGFAIVVNLFGTHFLD